MDFVEYIIPWPPFASGILARASRPILVWAFFVGCAVLIVSVRFLLGKGSALSASRPRLLTTVLVAWAIHAWMVLYTIVNVAGFKYGNYNEGPVWVDEQTFRLLIHTSYLMLGSTVACLVGTVTLIVQHLETKRTGSCLHDQGEGSIGPGG